jgi:hypothetical protein
MNIILYAVPFFFLLIFIELLLEKSRGTDYYRVNDSVNSLTVGVSMSWLMIIWLCFKWNRAGGYG